MRVLLIEDDSATAQSIELMLKSESFNVYTTDLGEEGVDLGKLYDYDIILLDLNLPDMSGYEVLRTLRLSKVKTPILILSGMAGIEDKVRGLGFGADDYMTKPFHKDELVARIHAIVRRSKGHAQSVITTGDLIVNLDAKTVEVTGQRVHLTGKEYQMLELLSLRRISDNKGVHLAVDGIGGSIFMETLKTIRPFGILGSIGQPAGPVPPVRLEDLGNIAVMRPSVIAAVNDPAFYQRGSKALITALQDGLSNPIGAEYHLRDAAGAQADLEAGKTTGSVILTT